MGNRSNLNAVEKARMSHSDDATSSNAFLNHRLRDGFGEPSLFSELAAMTGAAARIAQCGNEGVGARCGVPAVDGTLKTMPVVSR